MAFSIYVKGFKPDTTIEQLIMYFQSSKLSGGGDVDPDLSKIEDGMAIIVFDEDEDRQRVLQRSHTLDGIELRLSKIKFQDKPKPTPRRTKQKKKDSRDSSSTNRPQSVKQTVEKEKETDASKAGNTHPFLAEIRSVIVRGISPKTPLSTLQLFFENEKRSGGGDIESLKIVEPQVAHITFKSSEVALRVSGSTNLKLDGQVLKVKAQKPELILPVDKKKLYFQKLSPETTKDALENYAELITRLDVTNLQFGKNSNALITFGEEPDMTKVKEKTKQRSVESVFPEVSNPPVCNSVLVSGISKETTEDTLLLKFENPKYGGGSVYNIEYQKDEGKAIISFWDPNVVHNLLATEQVLNNSKLTLRACYPFMEDDKAANEKRSIPVRADVIHFVSNFCDGEFSELFGFPIKKAKYDEKKEELNITPPPEVQCTKKIMTAIHNYFCTFEVKEIQVSTKLLETSKDKIKQKLDVINENFEKRIYAAIDFDNASILVTGKKNEIEKVDEAIQKEIDEIYKRIQTVSSELSLDQHKLMLCLSLGFDEEIETKFSIDVKSDLQNGKVLLTGPEAKVNQATLEFYQRISNVKEDYIDVNERQEDFLTQIRLDDLNGDLKKKKVEAMLCLDKSKPKKAKVELYGSEKFNKVYEYLLDQIFEEYFTVENESLNLLKSQKWKDFVVTVRKRYTISLCQVGLPQVQIWLTGEKNNVKQAYEDLENFVRLNTIIQESVEISEGMGRHLSSFCAKQISEIQNQLEEHLVSIRKKGKEVFLVQGTKEGVKKAKALLQDVVDNLAVKKVPVETHGMQKYIMTTTGRSSLAGIEKEHQCTIHPTDDSEKRSTQITSVGKSTGNRSSSVLLCSYQTPENVLLKVYQADLTTHRCDVIVNAANGNLHHVGGLAKMIVDLGGQEIQEDCNEYVKVNGRLLDGEIYCGIPGKLPCKRVIHAVAPRWDNAQRVKIRDILKYACKEALKGAKPHGTIALPALGSGIFDIPKAVCADVMLEAAVEFSSESSGSCSLKEIHFVNIDSPTAKAFLEQFRKCFSAKPTFSDNLITQNRNKPAQTEGANRGTMADETSTSFAPSAVLPGTPKPDCITTNTQTSISVIVGDLSTHKADILVNTTSEYLKLDNNPCSRALSNEAGPTLQQECNKIGKLKVGDVAFTKGGNLLCKEVCHVTCTQWNNGQGENVLRSIIKNCLKESHSRRMTSVAFPAIGTGILRFPHAITAKICFEESKEFGKKHPTSSVKDIRFVVFHQDQESIKAFKEELKKQPEWKASTTVTPSRKGKRRALTKSETKEELQLNDRKYEKSKQQNSKHMEAMTESEGGQICINVGDVAEVRILQGDITRETTDVIAHLSDSALSMYGGVAQAIIKVGGKEIEDECKKVKDVSKYDVILTHAGRLRAKYIAHLIGPKGPDPKDIEKCITNCLKQITKHRCKSISLPAIATGRLCISPEKSAKAMLAGIIGFLQSTSCPLQTVRIVIYEEEVHRKFTKAVKALFEEDEESTGWLKAIYNGIVGFFTPGFSTKNTKPSTLKKQELYLEIYADNVETITKVLDTIKRIMDEQMKKEPIENELIEKLSESQVSRIFQLGEQYDVKVTIQKTIKRIVVYGHLDDVSKVVMEINSILNEVKMAEHERDTAEIVSKGVQWSWLDTDGSQVEYDVFINSQIEKAYTKQEKSVIIALEEGQCEIVFDKMKETNLETNEETEVFRKDLRAKAEIAVPDYWDPQPKDTNGKEHSVHIVLLDPKNKKHSKEYKEVSDGFYKTAATRTIRKIERIQNPSLYKQYALKKQSMDENNGSNEKFLYHGTATDKIPVINQYGLNRSYTGSVNGTAYGKGVYFATNASMSEGYAPADSTGNRTMYVARVAVGQFTKGNSTMIVPPNKTGNIAFDSVVDNVSNPGMFILFYDSQYYPEYLITF